MNRRFFAFSFACLCAFFAILLPACKTANRGEGFELSDDDYLASKERPKHIYVTGTKSIDSADASKMFLDVWKTETEDYPREIRIWTRVLDSSGNFITNMAAPYYRGSGDYRQYWSGILETLNTDTTRVTNFSVREFGDQDSIPYSIFLALDHGGSMRGAIDAIQDGAEMFVNLKRSYDQIAVAKFDKKTVVEAPMSHDKAAILQKFKKSGLEGFGLYSAVFDALKEGVNALKTTPQESPRVLVVFSDGEDNFSKTSDVDLYKMCREHNVRVFPVGFGYTNDSALRHLANFTGGKAYKAYSRKELSAVFEDIYRSLRNFYKVSYAPPQVDTALDGLHRVKISMTLKGGNDSALSAYFEYDKSPLNPFKGISDIFSTTKIMFDFRLATLRPESAPILDNLARSLIRYPRMKLRIQGHTDNIGTEDFNQKLSEQRANSVVDALVQRGVHPTRLQSRGFGFSQPVAPNDTEENRQRNRRTEFVIIAR